MCVCVCPTPLQQKLKISTESCAGSWNEGIRSERKLWFLVRCLFFNLEQLFLLAEQCNKNNLIIFLLSMICVLLKRWAKKRSHQQHRVSMLGNKERSHNVKQREFDFYLHYQLHPCLLWWLKKDILFILAHQRTLMMLKPYWMKLICS